MGEGAGPEPSGLAPHPPPILPTGPRPAKLPVSLHGVINWRVDDVA